VRDDGIDALDGEAGELWLANPATMAGYWNDPPATAVSSLPRGAPRPLSAARGPMLPMVSAPPPQPPPPRPAPAAPHPQSKASRDKSEVL